MGFLLNTEYIEDKGANMSQVDLESLTYTEFCELNQHAKYLRKYKCDRLRIEEVTYTSSPAVCVLTDIAGQYNRLTVPQLIQYIYDCKFYVSNPSKLKDWKGFKEDKLVTLYFYEVIFANHTFIFNSYEKQAVFESIHQSYSCIDKTVVVSKQTIGKVGHSNKSAKSFRFGDNSNTLVVVLLEPNVAQAKKLLSESIQRTYNNKQKDINYIKQTIVESEKKISAIQADQAFLLSCKDMLETQEFNSNNAEYMIQDTELKAVEQLALSQEQLTQIKTAFQIEQYPEILHSFKIYHKITDTNKTIFDIWMKMVETKEYNSQYVSYLLLALDCYSALQNPSEINLFYLDKDQLKELQYVERNIAMRPELLSVLKANSSLSMFRGILSVVIRYGYYRKKQAPYVQAAFEMAIKLKED